MVAKLMTRNSYMDDFVKSVATEKVALEVYTRLQYSLYKDGFQLTKWICNSKNVMKVISPEDRWGVQSKTFEAGSLAS